MIYEGLDPGLRRDDGFWEEQGELLFTPVIPAKAGIQVS
jgi:hypothetical protein